MARTDREATATTRGRRTASHGRMVPRRPIARLGRIRRRVLTRLHAPTARRAAAPAVAEAAIVAEAVGAAVLEVVAAVERATVVAEAIRVAEATAAVAAAAVRQPELETGGPEFSGSFHVRGQI